MREPKMLGLSFRLLLLSFVCTGSAEGNFEDAETSKDYTSISKHQKFDLRHTIPGEPEVDYPIYSSVPRTSFVCTGRHEGYYADVETRCQAFRICAHTARSINGFAFLCPNGTLFSQKNFVCDWYRNVKCEESEQYYIKNNANRVGSNSDMMEKVRQMMEYPMKKISQLLQTSIPPKASHHTLKKQLELAESGLAVSEIDAEQQSSRDSSQSANLTRKPAVTRAEVESVSKHTQLDSGVAPQHKSSKQHRHHSRHHHRHHQHTETKSERSSSVETVNSTVQTQQTIQAESVVKPNDEDLYVNSLGELSSDPGVNFAHDTAHILAEAPSHVNSFEKKSNFAEKVNVALNDPTELPENEVIVPDYVKNLNQPDEDLILAANINNLLDGVSTDLDTSVSGYQVPAPRKSKASFRFLSRGFSSQSDRAKRPTYEYAKPKQTASTIRFTPNELPIDDTYKDTKESLIKKPNLNNFNSSTYKSADDERIEFSFMPATPTPQKSDEIINGEAVKLAGSVTAELIERGEGFKSAQERATTENPTVTTIASAYVNSEKYYLNSVANVTLNLDYDYLSPPLPEIVENIETSTADEPTLFEFKYFDGVTTSVTEVPEMPELMETITQTPSDFAQIDTTTETGTSTQLEEMNTSADIDISLVQKLPLPTQEHIKELSSSTTTASPAEEHVVVNTYPAILDEEKLDVEKQAAKLLLAGVKLTKHDSDEDEQNAQRASGSYSAILDPTYGESGALFIHVDNETIIDAVNTSDAAADATLSSTTTTTTTTPTTTTTTTIAQPLTSTTVIANVVEGDSFQERVRNYRRFSAHPRATAKPNTYEKRTNLQAGRKKTITTTETPTTTSTAKLNYLKRVSASRLHLARLAAANNQTESTTTSATTDTPNGEYNITNYNDIESSQKSKKISVRNIDKELSSASDGKHFDARGNSFDKDSAQKHGTGATTPAASESVRKSLRRFQVSRRVSSEQTTTVSPQQRTTKSARKIAARTRNRFVNFKKQRNEALTSITSSTTTTTAASPVPSTQSSFNSSDSLLNTPTPNLEHILKSITSSVTDSTSSSKNQAPTVTSNAPQTIVTYSMSSSSSPISAPSASSSIPSSTSLSSSSSAVTTHGDSETFLDFDKLTRAIVDDSILQNFHSRAANLHQTTVNAAPRSLSVDSNRRDFGNSVQQRYEKLPPQAPYQLKPPQRPQHLPQFVKPQAPTSPAPRVVIARAEGQRIAPNSVPSIISSLVTQPPSKPTPTASYVALDDFLTKKFGQTASSYSKTSSAIGKSQQQQQQVSPQFQRVATTTPTFLAHPQQQHHQQPQQTQQPFIQHFQQTQQQQKQLQHLAQQQQLHQLQQFQHQQQEIQQQQQLEQQQQQQYGQKQKLQELQNFQQFTAATRLQEQQQQQHYTTKLTQPQQYNSNGIYQAPQQRQQLTLQQKPSWLQQQQQAPQQQLQQSLQYTPKPSYLQSTQAQQQFQPQQSTSTQFYYPQQQQHQQSTQVASFVPSHSFNTIQQQQQQQQQLPQFPPLGNSIASATPGIASLLQQQSLHELSNSIVPAEHDKHLNIQLPALPAGLIPTPTRSTLNAQRRLDVGIAEEDYSSGTNQVPASRGDTYTGVTSYDVPLSSIGRLPNDITQLLRRRLRKVK